MTDFHVFKAGNHGGFAIFVRRITTADIVDALRRGFGDFWEIPSHQIFVVVVYPVIGFVLFAWVSEANAWHLIYPLVAGFALFGPIAALGLYEISRRRELGLNNTPQHILQVIHSPAIPSIAALGLWLLALFIGWVYAAHSIYSWLFADAAFESPVAFLAAVIGTAQGWKLLLLGNLVGLGFGVVVLATTVVAFPLLLDRDVGLSMAVAVSVFALLKNPAPVLSWGVIVVGLLLLGALPALVGLVIVLPVLGHSTWHVYRKIVRIHD